MWPDSKETANLVTFTEEILNRKPHLLWSCASRGAFMTLSDIHDRIVFAKRTLREKCPNTEFFLVRIFWHSDQKSPYLDTFQAVELKFLAVNNSRKKNQS